MKYKSTINIITNRGKYWAFTFICHITGKRVCGTVAGNESNIRAIARNWNVKDGWDRSILFNMREVTWKDFKYITKEWKHAGCNPDELAAWILEELRTAESID